MTTHRLMQPTLANIHRSFSSILFWLVQPHKTVVDAEKRQHARLLSSILLMILVVGVALLSLVVYLDPNDLYDLRVEASGLAILVVFGLYVANRLGYTQGATLGLIISLTVVFMAPVYTEHPDPTFLVFVIVPMLIAGMFLSFRWTAVVVGSIIAAVFVLNLTVTGEAKWQLRTSWYFLSFAGALLLTFIYHLHNLEVIRRAKLEEANSQLRASEAVLEQRVEARTRDLQIAANVSRQVTTVLDRDVLLPQLVKLTGAGFGLSHVAVFLYDPARNELKLSATTGGAEKRAAMLGLVFNLSDDEQGLILEAARQHQAVVVNDVQREPRFRPHALLPDTCSEAVFPMLVGTNLIGVLDLQSDQPGRFSDDDARVLTTLAEQIAIAVRNAQLFAESQAARREAEKSNVVKSQFLAAMSHELRTPLNAILNFSQFVSSGMLGSVNDEQVDILNKITSSGRHLLSLINDVLDISKIESGALTLFVEAEINLANELQSIEATARSMLNGKPVKLTVDMQDDLPLVVGDKRRIRQIALNLVSNACKFTDEGEVAIQLRQQSDSEILLTVRDTGPGIAPEDHDAIFETFRQTEAGLRHSEGTGLGLPISRRLAEAHGGRLWLESALGQGATFYVALPIRSPELLHMIVTAEKKQ
jgi:signal transduction histidine kinase